MRLKWKFVLVHLEIVLILTQDRSTVCAELTIGSETILDAPDGTPWWCGSCGISLWSIRRKCFGHSRWYFKVMRVKRRLISIRLEIVLILTQNRCTVCAECTIGSESFCMHPMELLGAWVMWNLVLVRLEIVSLSVHDRSTICAKRTIGLEIIFDMWTYLMELLGDDGHLESLFGPFGECVSVGAR
jgi:hypothetical protein